MSKWRLSPPTEDEYWVLKKKLNNWGKPSSMTLKLDRKENLTSTLLTLNHGIYKDQSTYIIFKYLVVVVTVAYITEIRI